MRLVLLLLAVAGIGLFWWLAGHDGAEPPPSTPPPAEHRAARDATPGDSERSTVPLPTPTQPNEPLPTEPPTPIPESPAPPTAPAANVVFLVRDVSSRTAIPTCRWRFRRPGGVDRGEGPGEGLAMALPPGSSGELLIEANDHQPFQQPRFVVPGATEPVLHVDVFLTPAVVAAGITLIVHDPALQPIPDVRVDAFRINDDNRELDWSLGNSLWARRSNDKQGRFPLPPLPPGEYGIRLIATDADGNVLPYLPYSRTFRLTGDNGFVEDVPLEAGCLPVFELVDATNNAYDPTAFGTATLSLRWPGGPSVQRKWIVGDSNASNSAIDVLPGIGPCWPAEPLPAGTYTFEVFVNGAPRVQRSLQLRAGERQVERIVVP